MKKLNYLAVLVLSVFLISCGGKNSEKKGSEADVKEASVSDCLITELDGLDSGKNIVKRGTKDLYTGLAVEKDQNDSIIRKVEVKNGWLIKDVTKKKIFKKYITKSEYNYENGEVVDKYSIEFVEFSDEKGNKFTYVLEYLPKLDGLDDEYFRVDATYWSSSDNYQVDFTSRTSPNFLKDFEKNGSSREWIIRNISSEKMYQILDAMKKELPHFDYWKNK